jgi:hypothetical protein
MISLDVTLSPRDIAKFRTLLKANPRIAAQSLTFTAERAQDAWRAGHSVFHKRRDWIDKGVRIKHATPGTLRAEVGTIDRYMGRHVKGVDEPKRGGSGRLFVPVQPVEQQPTHTRIRAALRAMQRTKTRPFWRKGALLRRTSTQRDAPLKVLAVLRQSVEINPRLDAVGIVERAVHRHFPTIYHRLILKWAATA